jgi:hypothetical protein
MRYNNKVIILGLLVVTLTFLLFPTACKEESEDDTMWFDDPPGFITRNLEIAQNETPFTIILPTYTPDDFILPPHIRGHLKEAYNQSDIFSPALSIDITYYRSGQGFPAAIFREYNTSITQIPRREYTFFNIHGVEVLEHEYEQLMFSESETYFMPGFSYSWNFDGRHFRINIYEYEQDECRKIVESMIQ